MFSRLLGLVKPVAIRDVAITALNVEMAQQCALLHMQAFAYPWKANDFEALLSAGSASGDAAVASGPGRLLGFVLSRLAADEAEILTLVVAASHRRLGLGRNLLIAHIGRIAAAGGSSLFLEVDEQNAPALGLYKGLGFSQAGTRPAYYRKADETRAGALILRLAIG